MLARQDARANWARGARGEFGYRSIRSWNASAAASYFFRSALCCPRASRSASESPFCPASFPEHPGASNRKTAAANAASARLDPGMEDDGSIAGDRSQRGRSGGDTSCFKREGAVVNYADISSRSEGVP